MPLLLGQADVKFRDSRTVHIIQSIIDKIPMRRFEDSYFKLCNVTVQWVGEIIQMKMEK